MIDCHADPVDAARHLARAFSGGRWLVVVAPDTPDHARHVAVEFLHPVVTGAVALPARVAPPVGWVRSPGDVVLAIGDRLSWDHQADVVDLVIPALSDAEIMTSYHLLWELVQLELGAVSPDVPPLGGDGDSTDFLYPFLEGAVDEAVADLTYSAQAKAVESASVASAALAANGKQIAAVVELLAATAAAGGRVLTMGNGGSACDADRMVRLLSETEGPVAHSLAADSAVVTALANDLGTERVFARQLEALGRPGDVLVGFSTSGTSANLLAGFDQAKRRGLSTVGCAGYDGGGFEHQVSVDITLAVGSQSVHRIQEAQAVLLDAVICRLVATSHLRGAG